jgi:hypothetical protein
MEEEKEVTTTEGEKLDTCMASWRKWILGCNYLYSHPCRTIQAIRSWLKDINYAPVLYT